MANIEERAAALLGLGIAAETVAANLGVTPSAISQLLAREDFASRVAELRYNNLASQSERDGKYDKMEDALIDKLEQSLPMMYKPRDILQAISVINGAKRRGAQLEPTAQQNKVVNLILPAAIINQFTVNTNVDNQVTRVGDSNLVTLQSSSMEQLRQLRRAKHDSAKLIEDSATTESADPAPNPARQAEG